MGSVRRYDSGTLGKPEYLENGWAKLDSFITRTGVFTYYDASGNEFRELRLEDDVFAPDALASFGLVPLTNDHPPSGLDAKNTTKYAVGVVAADVRRDADKVRASLSVWDAETIDAMKRGKVELSCGYNCDLEMTAGEHNGEHYDAIQRNIRGNHVALVDRGRAGPEVRIRLDGADRAQVACASLKHSEEKTTMTEAEMKARIDAAEAKQKDAEKRADSAEAEIAVLKSGEKNRADAAEKAFQARVTKRVELIGQASGVLAEKLDGKTDREIKVAVLGKLASSVKCDGRSDEFVDAAFEVAIAQDAEEKASAPRNRTEKNQDGDARSRMIAANQSHGSKKGQE